MNDHIIAQGPIDGSLRITADNERKPFDKLSCVIVSPAMGGRQWKIASRVVDLSVTADHGCLNVTPDSFSDGGRFLSTEKGRRARLEHVAGRCPNHRCRRRIDATRR
jgi:hypothetical protein